MKLRLEERLLNCMSIIAGHPSRRKGRAHWGVGPGDQALLVGEQNRDRSLDRVIDKDIESGPHWDLGYSIGNGAIGFLLLINFFRLRGRFGFYIVISQMGHAFFREARLKLAQYLGRAPKKPETDHKTQIFHRCRARRPWHTYSALAGGGIASYLHRRHCRLINRHRTHFSI